MWLVIGRGAEWRGIIACLLIERIERCPSHSRFIAPITKKTNEVPNGRLRSISSPPLRFVSENLQAAEDLSEGAFNMVLLYKDWKGLDEVISRGQNLQMASHH